MDRPIPRWRQTGRQAGGRQTTSRLPVANQVFLGSWTVDIHQEGRSLRSDPQRRHTARLRWCSCGAPRKWSGWDRGGDKMHHTPGIVRSPSTWSPEFLRPWEGHRSLCLCGVPENLNLSSLDLGSAYNLGPLWTAPLQSSLEPEQCRLGKHRLHDRGQTQCGPDTVSAPHTRQ